MRLEDIGFYTLCDYRASKASATSSLSRCELILTGRCNFSCPYCRHVGGRDLSEQTASDVVKRWCEQGLDAIRFSGGEPTLYPALPKLARQARDHGVSYIAVSTNGSADLELYFDLMEQGVNDFSISLDACCAAVGDKMTGGVMGAWEKVVSNIRILSQKTYVTVGVVLTEANVGTVNEIIRFAHDLGVSDIRIIPAAQDGNRLQSVQVDQALLDAHPILKYRVGNIKAGRSVRGICGSDCHRCGLVLDDMAVMGRKHFPCIIYMRERGKAIGTVGPKMRQERERWFREHDTFADPICRKNCLDVCIDYNNRFAELQPDLFKAGPSPVQLAEVEGGVVVGTSRSPLSLPVIDE